MQRKGVYVWCQFSIHFKGLERARTDQEKREEWLIIWGTDSAVPCKKSIRSNPYLVSLFNQFIQEIISKETGYQYIIQSLNIQLLISLLRVIGQNLKEGERNDRYYQKIRVEKALNYLSTHYLANYFE